MNWVSVMTDHTENVGAAGGDELFQIRREQAEIVRALGLGPGWHALAAQLGEGGVLVGGDSGDLVVLALQIADLGALLGNWGPCGAPSSAMPWRPTWIPSRAFLAIGPLP